MTLEQLINHFVTYPSYLETGAPKLSKQFNVSVELINQAKQEVRNLIKQDIMKEIKQESISLKDLGRLMGMDMDSDYPKLTDNDDLEGTPLQWVNQGLRKAIVSDGPQKDDQWEEKVKWVKTKEESKLLVKKEQPIDYKKDFEQILKQYRTKSLEGIKLGNIENHDNVLLVYMSDKHIGAETKEGLFKNEWNKQEFEKRMTLLTKEIIRLDNLYHFEKVILFDLGDAVDGFNQSTTRGGHVLPQNMNNREVYNTFIQVHSDFFYTLSTNLNCSLAFITAGESNHGGDFEYICNKSLEAILNIRFPLIETFIGDKFIEHYEIGDHCFIVCHGKDAEDMKFPLPLNLNEKTELYFKKYIDAHNITSKFIHVIKGDLHSASCNWGQFFRYKNVLSMYGSSKWIQTNFMDNTRGVSMDILSNNSITEHQLFL